MKRCPECRRDYYDDSLLYCLDDGSALLEGPGSLDQRTLVVPQDSGSIEWSLSSAADFPTQVLNTRTASVPAPENSIAIIPFVNIGNDPDIEYFSDGLAEELLNVLSKIRGLRVAARTSSFSFKGKSTTVSEVGQALHVVSVVEGSIRMSGGRMRIAVQLVNVADGFQLWSDTYDRKIDDIFAVQDDIAQSVVGELRSRLLGEETPDDLTKQVIIEVAQASKGRSDVPEAQRQMLLGRYLLDRTTPDDTAKAVAHFNEAVELDPNFALCWAELGRAYSVQAGKAWVPVDQGFRQSRKATERALALEPDLAEAHAQLGRIRAAYDWDAGGALAAYSRALELAPGNSVVMDGASILEFKLGRFDRALALSRKVLEQDPVSGAVWHNLGLICHAAGLLDESESALRRALDLGPQRLVTTAMLSLVLAEKGNWQQAVELAEREPDQLWRLWALAIIYFQAGDLDQAHRILDTVINEYADGDAFQIGEIYAVLGEIDKAFEWLERAIAERDPGVTHVRGSPRFRPLHADPRWPALLKTIGFEDMDVS